MHLGAQMNFLKKKQHEKNANKKKTLCLVQIGFGRNNQSHKEFYSFEGDLNRHVYFYSHFNVES